MEDIVLSLEPAFHRIERFLLWHNRYASLMAFALGHGIFYAIARAGLRPFCAVTIVIFIFHVLDCIKKKRLTNDEKNLSELTQLVLRSYRYVCQIQEKLITIKTENRLKHSFIIILICLLLAYIGVKLNGFYVSYLVMLILFTLPAIVYHKLLPKLLRRLAPILEQLDQSMEYKRRTLIDRKDLLVKMKTPGLNENDDDDDDDDDVRKLQEQKNCTVNVKNIDQGKERTDSSSDIPSDSSSSAADEEKVRLNFPYTNVSDRIDSNKSRSTSKYEQYSRADRKQINTSGEPDFTSFDFLHDYEKKS